MKKYCILLGFVCEAAILKKTADRQALAKALVTFCDLCSPGTSNSGIGEFIWLFGYDSHLEETDDRL